MAYEWLTNIIRLFALISALKLISEYRALRDKKTKELW